MLSFCSTLQKPLIHSFCSFFQEIKISDVEKARSSLEAYQKSLDVLAKVKTSKKSPAVQTAEAVVRDFTTQHRWKEFVAAARNFVLRVREAVGCKTTMLDVVCCILVALLLSAFFLFSGSPASQS
jgi:hypothetical protein